MKQWLFQKIIAYLVEKEGYQYNAQDLESSQDVTRTILQDSFGFRYEIQVKVLGRIYGAGFDAEEMKIGSYFRSDL